MTGLYRGLLIVTSLFWLGLFAVLIAAPDAYVRTFGLPPDAGAEFVGRRAAPVFLGLAVMCWSLRGLEAGPARRGFCLGMAVLWAGIAVTGLWDFWSGEAGAGILVAAFVEAGFCAAFLATLRQQEP